MAFTMRSTSIVSPHPLSAIRYPKSEIPMRDDLIFLASSNVPHSRVRVDKWLRGYSTIQFATRICGTLFLSYDEREWNLCEGEWFFPAYPGPHIRFHPLHTGDDWQHRHIGFQGPLVESWRAAGLWPDAPQSAPDGEDWARRMDEIIALVRQPERLSRWRAINALEALLLELAQARQQQHAPDAWLERVLEQLDTGTGFDELSANMAMSPTLMRRRFKAATGITMQDHVLQKRLATARALLADTDLPLKAIAAQLGYSSEAFFSRQFKTHSGVAPGAFRRSRKLG